MAVTTDRGRVPGITGKALAVVGVLALVAAGWLGLRALDEPGAADAASSAAGAQVPMRTHGSAKGGFTVSAPASFRAKRQGEALSLVSRDRRIVVTVGPGPAGSLESAHTALSDAVVASYDGANLEVTDRIRIGGQPALRTVGSVAHHGTGVLVSLTTVAKRGRILDATAFASRDLSARQVARLLTPTVDSLRFAP